MYIIYIYTYNIYIHNVYNILLDVPNVIPGIASVPVKPGLSAKLRSVGSSCWGFVEIVV